MELKQFADKWCHKDYPPEPVHAEELVATESELKIRLPADYRQQVLAVGLTSPTLALLSVIDDLQLDLNDLSSLCTPPEIINQTFKWRAIGMPDHLLVIGDDCMGNKFCFDMGDLSGDKRSLYAPVYFWDHDFDVTTKIADSFSVWIESYLGPWSHGLSATDF